MDTIVWIMNIIIRIAASLSFVGLILLLISWGTFNENDGCRTVKMKWNNILKYYYINPDKWTFKSTYIAYEREKNNYKKSYIWIKLSFFDYLRFLVWVKHSEKQDKQLENNRWITFILEDIQKDIEVLKNQSNEEIKQANKIMKELTKNEVEQNL
jgi:hypothetical protein